MAEPQTSDAGTQDWSQDPDYGFHMLTAIRIFFISFSL